MKYNPHTEGFEKQLKNADDFCIHTIKLLKSEDICPRSARWLGADEIVHLAQRLHTELHFANNINVTNARERNDRHAAQSRAYSCIKTLGEKFPFDAELYNIDADKLEKWLKTKGKIQSWILSWQRSDDSRYSKIE